MAELRQALLPALLLTLACSALHAQTAQAPGLVDPGTLKSLLVQTDRLRNSAFTLEGLDAGRQLIVTGQYATGQMRDLTRRVRYEVTPAGIAEVDATGYVTALREGRATVEVQGPGELRTSIDVTVSDRSGARPLNFANDVVPIFTRFGCNSGGCHGKAGGQNGFQLSLLGFEPAEDYDAIVKEARGRRVMTSAADASILLQKPSGIVAHGGGSKIKADTPAYRVLKRWIERGTPFGQMHDPALARLEILPGERLLQGGGRQQLAVIAHYTDGASKDVTRLTHFEPNDQDMAWVSETGLVTSKGPGTVAIMARFQTQVAVMRATVPLGLPVVNLPGAKNFIDKHVFAHWQRLGLPPSALSDDATFLRRVTIDIAGRLPTLQERDGFLADKGENRRELLIDRLLAGTDYADHFAAKWSTVLRNKRQNVEDDKRPTFAFHAWIRASLDQNIPYDAFVRALLTATGEEIQSPPVAWYREVKDLFSQVEDTAQLFLGTRLACARCHHHPLEKWSQQDYYGMAAFFSRLSYKVPPPVEVPKGQKKPKPGPKPPTHIYHNEGLAKAVNPRTGKDVGPTLLGGPVLDIAPEVDPRIALADWLTSPNNSAFARALVNRYWKHFFGRGLVDPEDDLRVTNPAANPELLEALAKNFVAGGFDLKKLVRIICNSRAYQLSSAPNAHNGADRQSFARFRPRRLPAEVLFDAIDQVTLSRPSFAGVPEGTRAVQLPDNAFESYFLTVFGRPDASSACECERSSDVNLAQMLHLMNSSEILAKVGAAAEPKLPPAKAGAKEKTPRTKIAAGARLATLVGDNRPHQEKIGELFLSAYAREPTPEEATLLLGYIDKNPDNLRAAYEDILWVLINSEEFLFNH